MSKVKIFIRKVKSEVKKAMGKTIDTCKDILTNKETRLIIGLSLIGIGVALTSSVYMKIPN